MTWIVGNCETLTLLCLIVGVLNKQGAVDTLVKILTIGGHGKVNFRATSNNALNREGRGDK